MADARQAPPAPPAAPPRGVAYADSGAGGGHSLIVTRNVPPKRVQVVPGHEVNYGGRLYTGEDEPFLIGEGSTADQLAFDGHVVVVSHEEVEAWNGKEGDEIRKRALAWVQSSEAGFRTAEHARQLHAGLISIDEYADAHRAAHAESKPTHDHGFAKYEHADGPDAIPVDVTSHRQQMGQRHMIEGRQAEDADFGFGPSKEEES
jgi:hypothetical protein